LPQILTRVCRLAEYLTHAPCLAKVKGDLEHCGRTYKQKFSEIHAKMEEKHLKPINEMWPQNDSEIRGVCW
jgi:hypothetical protein